MVVKICVQNHLRSNPDFRFMSLELIGTVKIAVTDTVVDPAWWNPKILPSSRFVSELFGAIKLPVETGICERLVTPIRTVTEVVVQLLPRQLRRPIKAFELLVDINLWVSVDVSCASSSDDFSLWIPFDKSSTRRLAVIEFILCHEHFGSVG